MASRDFLKHLVSASEPTASTLGDEWFNPTTNRLYKRVVNNGTTVGWREVPQGGSTLYIGAGLSGTSFNGSTDVTIAIDSTVATLNAAQSFSALQTFNAGVTVNSGGTLASSGSVNFNNVGSTINIGTGQTTGTLTLGGVSTTTTLTLGQSTVSQTTNIQAGATASSSTKTINLGTGGLSGSTTTMSIGSTFGTTVAANGTWTFSTPLANSNLANSSVTIGTTAISLGASSTTLAGLTSVSSTSFVGALTGNASSVTNGVYTTDTGTVTNTMLAGSITNAKLVNSSVTVGTTAIALGASSTTLAGLTSVSSTGFTGALTGNASTATTLQTARTINGVSFDGSANITVTAAIANALTIGTGLSGTSYNGSSAVTIALASGYGDTQNPYASKTANNFLAAPNGTAGVPTFRAIVAADIPTLNQNTTGSAATLTTARNINGTSFNGSADITITAANPNALTIGTGLSGTSYTGSTAVTIAIDSTVATLTGTQTLTNKTLDNTNTITSKASLFTIQDATDTTKTAKFDLSGLTTATSYTYALPALSGSTLAVLGNITQNFTGTVTFSGSVSLNSAGNTLNIGTTATTGVLTLGGPSTTSTLTLGQSTVSQTTNIQAGATASGSTKTINLGTGGLTGSTTAMTIGSTFGTTVAANGTWTFNNDVVVSGNLTVNGTTTTLNANTLSVDDKNIEIGAVTGGNITGNITAGSAVVTGLATTANIIPGSLITSISNSGTVTLPASTTVASIDSATQITLNQALTGTGSAIGATLTFSGATDATANGGGITLKGATDKTIAWDSANSNWTSSENWNLATGKAFKINNTSVLSASTLGTGVTGSSLTSVGTITTGVWNGTTIALANGGTGTTSAQLAMNAFAGAVTAGSYLRGNGTNVVMSAIQAADVPTLNQNTTGSAATLTTPRTINGVSFDGSANITISAGVANALTIGTGLSGTSYNGSAAVTIAIDSTVTTLTGTQTLTNKTLTLPTIGGTGATFNGSTSGTTVLKAAAVAGSTTITMPATTGTMALTSDIPTVNAGTLGAAAATAGLTNTAVALNFSAAWNANSASNVTINPVVGPAITNLATFMTTATAGFIKRSAQDSYTIDTNTYLTANQSISLTGDITGTGTTSIATTLATVNSNVGTFNNVTVNGKGLVTAASNVAYLTSLTDTLATVTGRGNTTTTAINSNTSAAINLVTAGNQGAWLGGFNDATTGWSLSKAVMALKPDDATYSTIGMAGTNGLLYFARTSTGAGTLTSWLEVNSTGVANFKLARPQWNGTNLVVASDVVSSFSAGTTGLTPSTATTGAVTLGGTLAVANGGTGVTTAQAEMNRVAQAVTSGSYLRGNGTNVVMSTIQAADVPTLNQSTTGNAATATTLIGDQTNWPTYRTSAVANMLGWKNYGAGHVLFDASAGTSPTGSVVSQFNPANLVESNTAASSWGQPITLMGWNGTSTYGVKVDYSRKSSTTDTLATGRTISLTGDVTYTSGAFDGSAAVTGTATLANSGVTAGTYTNSTVVVDAKGRVTSASSGAASSDNFHVFGVDRDGNLDITSYNSASTATVDFSKANRTLPIVLNILTTGSFSYSSNALVLTI